MAQPAVDARHATISAPEMAGWWQGFEDDELTRLIGKALDENLDLAQAVARVSVARASLQSATAALLPAGQISGDAARARLSVETPVGELLNASPGFSRNGDLFDADVGASWEIDLFGGLRRSRESARALYQAARGDVAAAQLAVVAQTADVYVTIRGLQARIDIATEQIRKEEQLVRTIELQYSKGVAADLQLQQSRGALAQVEATLPVLNLGLDAAFNALDVLLGAEPGTYRAELAIAAPIPNAPAIANAGGPADLIRRRPDLVVADRKLKASNARIGAALAEYYPKFSLSGLLGTATTSSGEVFSGGANQWQGVLGLRWRLFDFGRVNAEVAAARGRNAEALAAYRLSVLHATEDVENSFSALVNREAQERALAGGEESLARARDASLAAYQGGVVSLIEVLDADNRLLAARDVRAQAKTEADRAAIASFRALGGGWNSDDRQMMSAR